jgi:putative membrane protein
MAISKDDRERIAAAIRAAEEKTSGEIVCVLAKSSSRGTALPVFIAAIVALALPWVLVASTALTVERVLAIQLLTFVLVAAFLCIPKIHVALMPRATRRAVAHRAAMEQFHARGIARTEDRCGILIFVSLEERYARVIVDDGIAARVPQTQWQEAINALTAHMRDGRIADGFIAAIGACGKELAAHFPRSAKSRDELPDKIFLI